MFLTIVADISYRRNMYNDSQEELRIELLSHSKMEIVTRWLNGEYGIRRGNDFSCNLLMEDRDRHSERR